MEYRPFGATGRAVSAIGQGTWNIARAGRSRAVAALRAGLDRGLTHVDTAEMYGGAEEIVREAIAGRREEVFLVSKVLPSNASRRGTRAACERSLGRLGTDDLDCYLLHWRGGHSLAETIGALQELKHDGRIRSWGVSNFDEDDLEEAAAVAGAGAIACNQVLYHLEERAIEHAVLPWCAARGVAVVAYSPFGSGDFPEPRSDGGRVLQAIADAHGATPRQIALRFLLRHPSVFVIPKASNPEHVVENAGAGNLRLTDDDMARIDEAFPRGARPPSLPML